MACNGPMTQDAEQGGALRSVREAAEPLLFFSLCAAGIAGERHEHGSRRLAGAE